MLNGIIDWSIQNRFFVILATIGIIFWGVYAVESTPLDAIPDLSDVQVIIYTDFPGQAPQVVEDQVTYPITTQMLAVPYAKVVRGYSFFGFSFVYFSNTSTTSPDVYLEELRRHWVRMQPASAGLSCMR
jgi:Cu(I)/Ag(I) efflux system membrane protein CusA/SilA